MYSQEQAKVRKSQVLQKQEYDSSMVERITSQSPSRYSNYIGGVDDDYQQAPKSESVHNVHIKKQTSDSMCWQTNSLQSQINDRLQQIEEAQKEVLMMQE